MKGPYVMALAFKEAGEVTLGFEEIYKKVMTLKLSLER